LTDLRASNLANDVRFRDLIERFRAGLTARIKAVEDAMNLDDRATLRRLAHSLRGAGTSFGYPAISAAARAVETAVVSEDVDAVRAGVRALAELCASACK